MVCFEHHWIPASAGMTFVLFAQLNPINQVNDMPSNEAGTQISETYDLVIIGGGIAGLYCCHELIKQRELLKINSILLLEASKRFGGRIETWSLLRTDEKNGEAIGFDDT